MDEMKLLAAENRDLIINSRLPGWGSSMASVAAMIALVGGDGEPLAVPPVNSTSSALQKARNLSTAPAPLPLRDRKKTLARKRAERKRG